MKRRLRAALAFTPALLLVALLSPQGAAAAGPLTSTVCTTGPTVTCDLDAKAGTLGLPDGSTVPIMGFAPVGGDASVPGPVLVATTGDTVTVHLTNQLAVTTSILFHGQPGAPDLTGVAAGASTTYTFTAGSPGTYLYEAGLLPGAQYQTAMGLHGALIVHPAGGASQANSSTASAFDDEALVVLGEVDTALNDSVDPAQFDLRSYVPDYYLINGKAHPQAAAIATAGGHRLLLRYLDAGLQHHSMGVLGLRQTVVNDDGSALLNPRQMGAESIAPGQGLDVLVAVPTSTAPTTRYPLYDASLTLNNFKGIGADAGIGGMITLIEATAGTAADSVGPVTSGVSIDATSGALTATVSDATTGNSTISAAEYFIDTTGVPGSGTAMTGAFGSPSTAVAASPVVDIPALSVGNHSFFVRGKDSANNWGPTTAVILDRVGPATNGATVTPSVTDGSAVVALAATADDRSSGGSAIDNAEYFIDAAGANGTGTAMTVASPGNPLSGVSASIAAINVNALSDGTHSIYVHAQDHRLNWGATTTVVLTIDRTGPAVVASNVTVDPNPNNGYRRINSTNPSVRVRATFDVGAPSFVAGAEAFIGPVGANGTGFPLAPTDGRFETSHELAYADIPLTTILTLHDGPNVISVHGRSAAGWGAMATVTLTVDKGAPTFTGITLTPASIVSGTASTGLTVDGATDGTGTGVVGGEFWIANSDVLPGGGTAFSGSTASVPTASLVPGSYTVRVRVRDAAGNWSAGTGGVHTASLTVTGPALATIFTDGFELQTLPGTWTTASTTNPTRLAVTPTAALTGVNGLRVLGNRVNYVQSDFGTAANPAAPVYRARFLFRPNANKSKGQDIFAAASTSRFDSTIFRVRYRRFAGLAQVQIQLGSSNRNTKWTTIKGGTAKNTIDVVWKAAGTGGSKAGTLRLYINRRALPSQTLTTRNTRSIGAVRLGSLTATGSATREYFDAFASKRSTAPFGR